MMKDSGERSDLKKESFSETDKIRRPFFPRVRLRQVRLRQVRLRLGSAVMRLFPLKKKRKMQMEKKGRKN